ncbi:hypothetical protein C1H46_017092 [Malus baccata]|uniref:Secreted protein n=1 Tax=Malus baccata TaxID=106549 RepID=A0A540MET9_MALBA|nr:hypothetical protein C1H46_017092 [Malus baccata]
MMLALLCVTTAPCSGSSLGEPSRRSLRSPFFMSYRMISKTLMPSKPSTYESFSPAGSLSGRATSTRISRHMRIRLLL